MSLFDMSTLAAAGVSANSATGRAAQTRANILEMTQAAEEAVLRPTEPGGVSHAMRATLAARIAEAAGDSTLAARYAGEKADLPDHISAFADKVANQTRDIAAEDIAALQTAGVADADIVRLCELVAFVAYQLRVVAGLRLMQGAAA